jgi:Xaa-Pro dipeptidase
MTTQTASAPVVPPAFSRAEMQRRRSALTALMAEADVDHLVVYGANRAGSGVQWLTGWPVTREAVVVHTPDDVDVLLVQFFNHVPQARQLAEGADVRWAGPAPAAAAAEELRRRTGGSTCRVGVVGALPFGAAEVLRDAVGTVIDLNPAYTRLRMHKSAEELAVLRRAAELTDLSCAALRDGAGPGSTDYELGALVQGSYLRLGGASYIHYFAISPMAVPQQCVPAQWPTGRRLRSGDALSCELSTSVGGDYPGQLLRTFTVDAEPTPLYRELHDVADAAFDAVAGRLRAGATAAELVEASGVIEDAGFTIRDDLVHGFVGGYLPPVLGSRSRMLGDVPDFTFAAGMTVVVQPNVVTPDETAGVQTGELLLVTDDGAERLHAVPRGLLPAG